MAVKVIKNGTYERRAGDLFRLFDKALRDKFDIVSFAKRLDFRKDPIYLWTLPCRIDVSIDRSRTADPEINVRRSDPINEGKDEKQWRLERFGRDYQTDSFDFGEVFDFIRRMTAENRKTLADHQQNTAAMKGDLFGKAVPPGVTLQRNASTGYYRMSLHVELPGLDPTSMTSALAAAEAFNEAVKGLPRHPEEAGDAT